MFFLPVVNPTSKHHKIVLKPHAYEVYISPERFRVVNAGRRFGKTYLGRAELIKTATKAPSQVVWYVAPTYKMAKRIMWRALKKAIPAAWIKGKPNETELTIELWNGSLITLCGADNYDNLRGPGVDFVLLDEFAFIKLDAWKMVIRPALSDRRGRALFLSTPDGFNHFYDFHKRGEDPTKKNWKSWHFTTAQGGWVELEEIELAREELDERTFSQEYLGGFESSSGRVYYAFGEDNIKPFISPAGATLNYSAGIDFNVSPYIPAVIFVEYDDIIHFVDEIVIPNGNTPVLIEEMQERYGNKLFSVYPDPTGKRRSTNAKANITDFFLLKEAGYNVLAKSVIKSRKDSIASVNSRLCSTTKNRRVFVDPKCKHIIDGMRKWKIKEGTSVPEDSDFAHIMDAVRYPVDYLYPLKKFERKYL